MVDIVISFFKIRSALSRTEVVRKWQESCEVLIEQENSMRDVLTFVEGEKETFIMPPPREVRHRIYVYSADRTQEIYEDLCTMDDMHLAEAAARRANNEKQVGSGPKREVVLYKPYTVRAIGSQGFLMPMVATLLKEVRTPEYPDAQRHQQAVQNVVRGFRPNEELVKSIYTHPIPHQEEVDYVRRDGVQMRDDNHYHLECNVAHMIAACEKADIRRRP